MGRLTLNLALVSGRFSRLDDPRPPSDHGQTEQQRQLQPKERELRQIQHADIECQRCKEAEQEEKGERVR